MIFKLSGPIELTTAVIAAEFPIFVMSPHMILQVPFGDKEFSIETTIGQLNFFKWAIENKVIHYIENNYEEIETDMNNNNSISKTKKHNDSLGKIRKRREELSKFTSKSLKKEKFDIVVKFG
jgi:hypothetical protein